MIRVLASILVRALVELGLVLFLFAAIFFVVAFRTARRFATPTPDKLDRLAGPLAAALGLVAARTRGDEPEDELADEPEERIDWREFVV